MATRTLRRASTHIPALVTTNASCAIVVDFTPPRPADATPLQEMDPYADPNAAYGGMYQSAHGAPPQGGPRQGMHYNQGHQPYMQGPPPDHMRGGYGMGYDDRGYSMRGGPVDHTGSGRKGRGGRGGGRPPNSQRGGMTMQHR